MMKQRLVPVLAAALTAVALLGLACSDDDKAAEDARDVAGSLEQFNNALNGTNDIVQASDGVKDDLRGNCGDLQDGVDSGTLDDFCEDLDSAVDDANQGAFDALKARWPAVERDVRADIAAKIGDAAD